ncbi:SDR family NAD(P)-dependent oxidoreductase [Paraburkholderia flava]|uniref:SDR family NAD(P)-dependent oxidoreductase n=1 Tax=Paraburkholderia flava TaxID=2547393 RepID=UPI001414F2A8|nr:SDR family NAD(P)-dependent oxidoreductase [Paraburkholderia flava]
MNNSRKTILVTGASRGLGKQIALDAARAGFAVAVNYRSSGSAAAAVVEEIKASGGIAVAVHADVSEQSDVDALMQSVMEAFGRIDCVINNAGAGRIVALNGLDATQFEDVLRINLASAFMVSQAAVPYMIRQGGGRLIFMSSLAARTGGLVSAAYAASKGGIEGLMHYYATYLLPHRITSNALAPALFASDIVSEMALPPVENMPLSRLGRADELWPALNMLIETEYMTGQTIHINAGRFMT